MLGFTPRSEGPLNYISQRQACLCYSGVMVTLVGGDGGPVECRVLGEDPGQLAQMCSLSRHGHWVAMRKGVLVPESPAG